MSSSSPLPSHVEDAIRWLATDFIDDAILAVTFEIHRAHKTGLLEAELGDCSDENQYLQVNAEGLDVFGQAPVKKSHECVCPNCSRSLAASRFAPHLEKCMGMGRNSSRIASRRIQNTSRDAGGGGGGTCGGVGSGSGGLVGGVSDDDGDDDWLMDRKKRRRDKNSPRRTRKINTKNTDGVSWSVISSSTESKKRQVLGSICGVVSEHTRKMCTRSMKCPQHTTSQRRAVREQLLGAGSVTADEGAAVGVGGDDLQVEVDVLDDGVVGSSSGGGRDSVNATPAPTSAVWDHDVSCQNSSSTSPADSTSTVLSSHSSHSTQSSLQSGNSGTNSTTSSGAGVASSVATVATSAATFTTNATTVATGGVSVDTSTVDSKGNTGENSNSAVAAAGGNATTVSNSKKDGHATTAAGNNAASLSKNHHYHGHRHSHHHHSGTPISGGGGGGGTGHHHHLHHHNSSSSSVKPAGSSGGEVGAGGKSTTGSSSNKTSSGRSSHSSSHGDRNKSSSSSSSKKKSSKSGRSSHSSDK